MAHFNPPNIQDNPHGWGPCAIPDQFKDLPYQPFSKGDRLGKVIYLSLWSLACTQYIHNDNHIKRSAPVLKVPYIVSYYVSTIRMQGFRKLMNEISYGDCVVPKVERYG